MCHLFLLSQASSGMLCHIDLSEFSGPVRKLERSHRRIAICRKARIYVCVCVFVSTSIFVIQSCLSLIELGHQKGHSGLTRARKVSVSYPFTSSWGIKFVPLILFFFKHVFFLVTECLSLASHFLSPVSCLVFALYRLSETRDVVFPTDGHPMKQTNAIGCSHFPSSPPVDNIRGKIPTVLAAE